MFPHHLFLKKSSNPVPRQGNGNLRHRHSKANPEKFTDTWSQTYQNLILPPVVNSSTGALNSALAFYHYLISHFSSKVTSTYKALEVD